MDTADIVAFQARWKSPVGMMPLAGAPLVTETSALYGWWAVAIPVFECAAQWATARIRKRPFRLAVQGTQLVALGAGLAVRALEIERARTMLAELDRDLDRQRAKHTWTGAHNVVTTELWQYEDGTSATPHDVFTSAIPHIVDRVSVDPKSCLARAIAGRKADVHELATEHGTIDLDMAIRSATNAINRSRNRPEDQIEFHHFNSSAKALYVISYSQSEYLRERLSQMAGDSYSFKGTISIDVAEFDSPGRRIVLQVNGRRLVLPADPRSLRTSVLLDPTPGAALLGAMWALLESTEAFHNVAIENSAPGVLAQLTYMAWSLGAVRRRGSKAHYQLCLLGGIPALIQMEAVRRGLRGRSVRPDGSPVLPAEVALKAPSLIFGFCYHSLTKRQRRNVGIELLVISLLGVWSARNRDLRHIAFVYMWNFAGFVGARTYRRLSEQERKESSQEYVRGQTIREDDLIDAGELEEWRFLERAATEALEQTEQTDASASVREELVRMRAFARAEIKERE